MAQIDTDKQLRRFVSTSSNTGECQSMGQSSSAGKEKELERRDSV